MKLPRPKSTLGAVLELVLIVAFAVGLALVIQAFVVKPYVIPSGSMKPTLETGQRVLVQRIGYHFSDPQIGDIVVFHPPEGAESERCGTEPPPGEVCTDTVDEHQDENFIKRVVATPGDTLKIVDDDHDDYEADDIALTRVVVDPQLYVAVLRAHKKLEIMPW